MFRKICTLLILCFLIFVLMPTASYAVSFTVRVIYFLPIDTVASPNVDAKIDRFVKSAQKLFANEMERHGYGRKTFTLETNAKGEIVVHRVKGRFSRAYYQTISKTTPELPEKFANQNNIRLIFLEGNQFHELLHNRTACGVGGDWTNGLTFYSGTALVPASGSCFNTGVIAHELGHTFGLGHNFENHRYLMGRGDELLAPCEAEWLSEHHYFNKTKILNNAPKVTRRYEPQAELENKIRFKVALEDRDGLHHVHFFVEENLELIGYQSLNGKRDTAEVIVRRSKIKYHKKLLLRAMDLNGNYYIYDIPIQSLPESIDPEPVVKEDPPQTPDFSHLKNMDVDGNGFVNIGDLEIVISNLGENIDEGTDPNPDVNRDGVVTQADVDLIIKQLNAAAAPTAPKVPERTQLLSNYPNPFNPDTWIPYQLATDSSVEIRIFTSKGAAVQTLQLGNQAPGIYQSRSRAAYWDGRNAFGEPVASGIYFYTLTAGDFTATRKMLIRK